MRTTKIAVGSLLLAVAAGLLTGCSHHASTNAGGLTVTIPTVSPSVAPTPAQTPKPTQTPNSTHTTHNGGTTTTATTTASSSPAVAIPHIDSFDVTCRSNPARLIQTLTISYTVSGSDHVSITYGTWTYNGSALTGNVGAPNYGCYAGNGSYTYTITASASSSNLSTTKSITRTGSASGTGPTVTPTFPPVNKL